MLVIQMFLLCFVFCLCRVVLVILLAPRLLLLDRFIDFCHSRVFAFRLLLLNRLIEICRCRVAFAIRPLLLRRIFVLLITVSFREFSLEFVDFLHTLQSFLEFSLQVVDNHVLDFICFLEFSLELNDLLVLDIFSLEIRNDLHFQKANFLLINGHLDFVNLTCFPLKHQFLPHFSELCFLFCTSSI